jgi:hypothetical protein
VAGHLIVLLPLVGAFILGLGVAAGLWVGGAAKDPGRRPARTTMRELNAAVQGRERQVEHVSAVIADVLRERDLAQIHLKLSRLQKWMTERPPGG